MSSQPSLKDFKKKGRLEAFSDGVFAIAITLLVIEIAVPQHAGSHLVSALIHERPVYLAYFIAFMSIGIVWIEHNALTEALERVDSGFLRLNLLLLLLVAFLPYPARVMQEYLSLVDTEHGGERTAVAFFGIVLFLMSLMLIVLGKYAEREGLFGSDAAEERQEEQQGELPARAESDLLRCGHGSRSHPALRGVGAVRPHRRLPHPPDAHRPALAAARRQLTGVRGRHVRYLCKSAADRPDPMALLEVQNERLEPDLVRVRHGRIHIGCERAASASDMRATGRRAATSFRVEGSRVVH